MSKKDRRNQQSIKVPPVTGESTLRAPLHVWDRREKNMFLVLAIFSFLLYFNTVFNDYSVDDNFVVNEMTEKGFRGVKDVLTSNWASIDGKGITYRAMSRLSIALENGLFPSHPGIHHFFNIIYFIISILVTFRFFTLLLGKKYQSLIFFGLVLFISHPIHVEVVASLKSRDEMFSFLFGMTYCYLGFMYYRHGRWQHLALAILSFAFSWMSKEGAPQYFPVLLLSCYFFGEKNYKRGTSLLVASLAVVIAYVIFHITFITKPVYDVAAINEIKLVFVEAQLKMIDNFSERYGTSFYGMLYYIRLLFFPFPLSFFYGYKMIPVVGLGNVWVILSILIYAGLFMCALISIRKRPLVAYLILFYFCSLAVFSTLIIPINGVVADRHIYMGSLSFCLLVTMLFFKTSRISYDTDPLMVIKKPLFILVFGFIVLAFSAKTIHRNTEWKDRITIARIDAKRNPNSGMAHLYYAVELKLKLDENPQDSAVIVPLIMKHQKAYIDIYDKDPVPYVRIASLYRAYYKDYNAAEVNYKKAISLSPDMVSYYGKLQNLYQQTGDTLKERVLMDSMKMAIPDAWQPYYYYGLKVFKMQHYDEAVHQFEKAMKYGCKDAEMFRFLGDYYTMYNMKGKLDTLASFRP